MKKFIALLILGLFVIGLVIGFGAGFFMPHHVSQVSSRSIKMGLPAVNGKGNGMLANLTTTVKPGSGLILVSINDVLAGFDMQFSARTAAKVASEYTRKSLDGIDLIYTVEADASSIDGPSAGGALAVSTIAALEGVDLNKSVMMTGTIDEDGKIGRASGISSKIRAAEENGYKLFLIPKNQSIESGLSKEKTCTQTGSVNYCRLDYVGNRSGFGLRVEEVETVEEAWRYFL